MSNEELYEKYIQKFGEFPTIPMPGDITGDNIAMLQEALKTGSKINLELPEVEARWFGYINLPPGAVI